MTVCIGALFKWNYAAAGQPHDIGPAAIAIGDRMITAGAGDIEYEPNQQKMWFVSEHIILMIAGDFTVHSQALKLAQAQIRGNPSLHPYAVATIYGAAIQSVVRKQAEDVILAPLNLNTETFLAQQREMSEHVAAALTAQMQDFQGPSVSAIVVGVVQDGGHLYEIDHRGTVRCFDDVAFAAIGIGASHVNSVMTQNRYCSHLLLAQALATTYAAKRAAETTPGVGKTTDIHLILKHGSFVLWPHVAKKLAELYDNYEAVRATLAREEVGKLDAFIATPHDQAQLPQNQEQGQLDGHTAGEGNSEKAGSSASESAKNPAGSAK